MSVQPFVINVPQNVLDDLQQRLALTRWPDQVENAGWDYGTSLDYLKSLVDYWQHQFDWRVQEARLNQFRHFRTEIDGLGIHFIHERGKGNNPLPIILTHGWPDSFFRMVKIIPMLTDPARFGGDPADSFDVIVPSVPGYGFSDRAQQPGMEASRVAGIWGKLMAELGYSRYAAHGGDVGSGITDALAQVHPDHLIGIHLTDVPYEKLYAVDPGELSEVEQQYMQTAQQWSFQEGAYAMLQATKPQTLAYGLNDSPTGLAAWIVEKFRAWSDCEGDVERRFSKDELLTNIMIYWTTETINSSIRYYHETPPNPYGTASSRVEVPTALANFPKDIAPAPRAFAERFFNVQRFTDMPRGGHFAALEEPELLVEDIRAFYRDLRG